MDPLDILLPELWRVIFEKVEDHPQDWLNMYRASPTFEEVVGEEERTRVLLTLVLPLVRRHLVDEDGEDVIGLLPLRLVSRHWKKAIDACLGPQEVPFGNENVNLDSSIITKKYSFGPEIAEISSFLEKFSTHPGNPFVGNFVRMWFQPDLTEEVLMESGQWVQRFMEKFGNQITRMSIMGITMISSNPRLDIFVDQFRSCVQLAPNLEKLTVQFHAMFIIADDYRLDKTILGNQPAPVITKLKSFAFHAISKPDVMVDLEELLVRLCCNPDTLKTAAMVGVPMELTSFPNLETASVEVTPADDDISNLMNTSWPLTRLTLSIREATTPSIALGCVEHFKNTLTSLWITTPISASQARSLEFRPDLPRLKFLIIHHHFMSRRFLSNLPRLEKLRILDLFRSAYEVSEWFSSMETRFSDLKIWELLPKLKQVEMVVVGTGGSRRKSGSKVCYREKTPSAEEL